MDPYQDFAQQNEDQNQLGWQLENPINFLMKKRRSPFFGPNPYSAMGLQNGGFQLEFVSISQVINHMTSYNSSALIG